MTSIALHLLAPLALALSGAPADTVSEEAPVGIAISSAKALTCAAEGPQVVDHALVLVRDGKIEAIGRQGEVEVPEGYDHVDLGDQWLMPGMIDLHCHVGGTFDINDGVFLANPGLRASVAVIPGNSSLKRGLASGVTSVLFIPGSGTNVGGQGILFKAGHDHFDDALIRQHGSLKIAQWGNPERWMIRPGKTFENYTIREIIRRGKGYAARRAAAADGSGPDAAFDPQLEIFDEIFNRDVPISVHTQIYQVVLATIDIIAKEMGANVFIDHGTFDGYLAAELAAEAGVNAILGPRNVDMPNRGIMNWVGANPERMQGVAAGYQERGHPMIGFNTDSPVIPQEELSLQATLAARHGFVDDVLQTVRGLTIVPAITAGIDDRIGSLEVGKDADILVITGHPADPRTSIEHIWCDGITVYDAKEQRLW
ncbi:MAG: amidohydrolase family protein [Planctomycetota bacterium]|jgi:imidazolonepropionase-like amidohydrolase